MNKQVELSMTGTHPQAPPELERIVVGNWKMHGVAEQVSELQPVVEAAIRSKGVEVVACLPATMLHAAARYSEWLKLGGQDCHAQQAGPFTGCISPRMLAAAGATYVIVGHSERRRDQHETDDQVRAKAEAAGRQNLTPIVCVGEDAAVRSSGLHVEKVRQQLSACLPSTLSKSLIVAYEPIWAIGTGRCATRSDIFEMHAAIRDVLDQTYCAQASRVRIVYGGSCDEDNTSDILQVPEVNGVLVGSASLSGRRFGRIVETAAQLDERSPLLRQNGA